MTSRCSDPIDGVERGQDLCAMFSSMQNRDWIEFYSLTRDNPHWPLLEKAASLLGQTGYALDLGCGAGRDTRYLLSLGWHVTAVDSHPNAIASLAALSQERLQAIQSSFEDVPYGNEKYDLISSQFSLPFLPPKHFSGVVSRIKQALKPGGIFTGQFFGIHDEWNTIENTMTFLTREQVDEQLNGLQVRELTEAERDGHTANRTPKHWHVFDIIAQKATR